MRTILMGTTSGGAFRDLVSLSSARACERASKKSRSCFSETFSG